MDRGARQATVHKVAESQTNEVIAHIPSSGLIIHRVLKKKTMKASTLRASLTVISLTK